MVPAPRGGTSAATAGRMSLRPTVLAALLASARSTPSASEPPKHEAAARERTTLYFRFALIDVSVADRSRLEGLSLCKIVGNPRYDVRASPAVAALEGELAEIATWRDAGADRFQ